MSTNSTEHATLSARGLFAIAIAATCCFVAAAVLGVPQLWGMNFLKYRSIAPLIAALLFLAASFVPRVSQQLVCAIETASVRLSRLKSARVRFGLFASIVFVLLASMTYQSIPLLGDGSLRAGEVLDFKWLQPTEFLDQLIHAVAFRYIFEPLALKPTMCYRIISILSGLVFIWGILKLSIYVLPQHGLFAFFAMITSGMAVLFFGYVESYSILAGLLPWISLAVVKAVDNRSSIGVLIVWVVVAVLVHSISLFIFGLPLIATIMLLKAPDPNLRKKLFLLGAVVIAFGTLAWYVLAYLDVGSTARYLLPILPKGDPGQGLLTVDHGLNLLNWLFLSALPFLLLIPVIFGSRATDALWASNRRVLAMTMILSSQWFLMFFNPQLGGPRDWDLFSLPAFMLIPASLFYLSTVLVTQRMMRAFVPVLVISLVTTWSFVTVNASVERSADRYVEILEVSRFKNQWVEFGELHEFAVQRPELSHRRIDFITKAWQEGPRNKAESLLTTTKIAQAYLESGSLDSADRFIDITLSIDSMYLDGYLLRLHMYTTAGNQPIALQTVEQVLKLMPDSARALREAGVTFLRFGHIERGRGSLEAALEKSPTDYFSLLNLGSSLLTDRSNPDRAIDLLSRAVLQKPKSFPANLYLAMAFEDVGRLDQTRKYLRIAAGLAADARQREAVQAMQGRISGN